MTDPLIPIPFVTSPSASRRNGPERDQGKFEKKPVNAPNHLMSTAAAARVSAARRYRLPPGITTKIGDRAIVLAKS
ncbi:hypothetical protein [Limobrevibacterium gyesilva]|uniref:Uncharacterized protein n=1 Tax=Limobrevibacterium gyesilva TaxID=2991712 RepID=A0AA41YKD3_9PROT|nr:hypothetical protein [Limobrevibacterium gyesilva]MCW3473458.1 hypothetical protein [Limobrevibacterium gyesilva]